MHHLIIARSLSKRSTCLLKSRGLCAAAAAARPPARSRRRAPRPGRPRKGVVVRPADADEREAAEGRLAPYNDRQVQEYQAQQQRMQEYQNPTLGQTMKHYFFAGIGMTIAFTVVGGVARMIF